MDQIRTFLSRRNAVWGGRGFNMTIRTEVIGFTGGKHPQPISREFVRGPGVRRAVRPAG